MHYCIYCISYIIVYYYAICIITYIIYIMIEYVELMNSPAMQSV